MLSEELILHFLPKLFSNYTVKEKSLLRITRNADIDTETIYDEDLDYRDAMENLIKQRKRMNPVRMELSRKLSKKVIKSLRNILGYYNIVDECIYDPEAEQKAYENIYAQIGKNIMTWWD